MFPKLILISALLVHLLTSRLIAEEISYKDSLLSKAKELNLSTDPQWIALLHYKTDLLGEYESMAEKSSIFFNSSEGKTNPEKELNATIEKFFEKSDRIEGKESQSYQCAFIARYSWLKEKLQFDQSLLPEAECKRFSDWFKAMNPSSLTLIFPSTYINNPASAFGHTLLRIDQPDQNERTRLLAYTAHFAAMTGGENALLYAIKGIFGGYPGFFSVAPYFEKVKKYSDLEKRDIWEYHLSFSKAEIELMLKHLWELRSVAFSYYYFDENCSYHLLSLLDVARPGLEIMRTSGTWVLPIDTVRALTEKEGLVTGTVFRPSVLTKLNYNLATMSESERHAAKKLVQVNSSLKDPEFENLSPESKAVVVDLSYEYLNYKILSGEKSYQQKAYSLLSERSSLPKGINSAPPKPEIRPDESHSTARIGAGFGRDDNKWFYDFRYRGVYHDLMDPKQGFAEGAQIELMDMVFRQTEDDNFRLNKADFVDIISLSPGNDLIMPKSWDIKFGFDTQKFDDGKDHLHFKLEGGFGYARAFSERAFGYGIIDLSGKFSDNFEDKYAGGAKPKIGLYFDAANSWRINLNASYSNYFLGDSHNESEYVFEQRFTISKNSALRLEFKHERDFSEHDNQTTLSFDYYL